MILVIREAYRRVKGTPGLVGPAPNAAPVLLLTSAGGLRLNGGMADNESPVTIIPEDSCWGYLASQEVGRLGVSAHDVPEIFPINYYVDGSRSSSARPRAARWISLR